ncbi:MAG: response regulator [Synergistaceae bacterium]|nr:response regulator [Synergistaceae bacterium]
MPGMDGVETLKHAKEIDESAKYIALTAHSGTGLRDEYIAMGFDDYLPKPMKADSLRKILALYIPENLKVR